MFIIYLRIGNINIVEYINDIVLKPYFLFAMLFKVTCAYMYKTQLWCFDCDFRASNVFLSFLSMMLRFSVDQRYNTKIK